MPTYGFNAVKSLLVRNSLASRLGAVALSLSFATSGLLIPAQAEEEGEWTVTLIKHANKASEAYNRGDYPTAKKEYRTAIGLSPKNVEFYEGLMNTGYKAHEWDQVAYAAEEIAKLDPGRRAEVAYFQGVALYQLNRYNEAIPVLRTALTVAGKDFPPFHPEKKDEALAALSHPQSAPVTPPPERVEIKPVVKAPERLNVQNYLGMESAAVKSECIVLARYEGYEKGTYQFNNPPIAKFNITKILKGPPLNKDLPIRFEFHDAINKAMPAGWKFDPKTTMPEKGSEWILFIEFVYLKNGAYDTYQGSYGRQPMTEENVNQLYELLDKYNMRNPNSR